MTEKEGVPLALIKRIGVLGANPTGRGIAELAATRGLEVVLADPNRPQIEQVPRLLDLALQHQLEKWAITEAEKRVILARIHFSDELADLSQCDLVIETLLEDRETREEVFRSLDRICRRSAVLASNTSTLSITALAAATTRPAQCIGLHFLQPVTRAKVTEMVRGLKTSNETVQCCLEFLATLEMTGVEVYEAPGYITSRLMAPLMNEAANLVMEGVATTEAIDTAMRLGYHMDRGPLEMADRMGLHTLLVVLERLWEEYRDPRYRPSPLLKKLVRAGHTGADAGEGFFCYDAGGNRLKPGRPEQP